MKKERIAFYAGNFDPPGLHHINIVKKIIENNLVDKVIVVPAGYEQKKAFIPQQERRKLIELSFSNIDNVFIDFINIDHNKFIRYSEYEEMFGHMGEVVLVIGADHLHGGENSAFLTKWTNGKYLFENSKFIVITRKDYNQDNFLPLNSVLLETDGLGSSTEIRRRIKLGENIDSLVVPEVAVYIKNNKLYE